MACIFLDFDGYVAKSYYASISKDNIGGDSPIEILENLEYEAVVRAVDYFNTEDITVYRIMSGHTFKKDIFPSYKNNRKKDDDFGEYRDYIKDSYSDVTIAENIEADDLITFMNAVLDYKGIVFSDDKDLRKYNHICCRINPTEDIIETYGDLLPEQCIQMISGDSIDNIKGIKGKGEVWARKYLDKNGYTLNNVIKAYKDNNIDIDECFNNLVKVIPLSPEFLDEEDRKDLATKANQQFKTEGQWNYETTMKIIESFLRYLNKKVKEIYNENTEEKK